RARRGAGDEDGAENAEGRDPPRQPLRPRRQGPAHGRRARGQEALMSRIQGRFQALAKAKRKALIPYITAGDPHPSLTVPLLRGLVEAGADIVELGVPFSDPMADGPVIQRSGERALKHGVGLGDVLKFVTEFRKADNATPIVLMGYANPIEAMGTRQFLERAKAAGVDGVLVLDYPPEECAEFAELTKQHDIDPIFLLAPTSSEKRIHQVARCGSGY